LSHTTATCSFETISCALQITDPCCGRSPRSSTRPTSTTNATTPPRPPARCRLRGPVHGVHSTRKPDPHRPVFDGSTVPTAAQTLLGPNRRDTHGVAVVWGLAMRRRCPRAQPITDAAKVSGQGRCSAERGVVYVTLTISTASWATRRSKMFVQWCRLCPT